MTNNYHNTIILMENEKNTKILQYLGTRSDQKTISNYYKWLKD